MASDNAAGVHPAILEAVTRANSFHALGYGHDQHTPLAKKLFNQLFDAEVTTEFVFGGTGANVLALACMLKPAQAVVCTSTAHIAVDEAGAPERFLGAKLIDIPTIDGKLRPSDILSVAHLRGSIHHAEPAVVSITQATEMGTIYTADEVRKICETAHELDMLVHMDGARITNASAALGASAKALRSFTIDAGVDVLSFGGVKAGLMFGEFLQNDLLFKLAANANSMALALYEKTRHHQSLGLTTPPVVNSLFPTIESTVASALREWTFFWDWDVASNQYRWMTAWDTTLEDVNLFADGVSQALKI